MRYDKFRLELNSEGVRQLLNDPAIQADLKARAENFRRQLEGEWALVESRTDRVGYVVRPDDDKAREMVTENPGRVLGALGGGAGG